ncbi:radical SAM protein [Phormidesmis sp. 146-12]
MTNTNEKFNAVALNNESITVSETGRVLVRDANDSNLAKIAEASNRNFHLILMPTEKCNFRCTYCYEDFVMGRMKQETILGVKALLERRCVDLDYLNIAWFGGEPLIAKDIVLEISSYATTLARRYPRLRYESDMTTNGYLLDYNTAKALADVGVRCYQVSLDGSREIHDKSRIRADGSSTYDQIWSNLLALRDSSLFFHVRLRIHFTVDTLALLAPLIEDIKKEFIDDSRFSVFFKAIEQLGGANDASIKTFPEAEKKKAINSLETKLYGKSPTLERSSFQAEDVCYASRLNSLVVRSNGDIGKCTVALYDERNKIGLLQPDGTLKLTPGRLAPWVRGIETLDLETLSCPLVGLPPLNEATSN